MAPERELKLSAPPGFKLPDFAEFGIRTQPEADRRLVTTYFDTPDLRLARWGVTLRYRAGEGWTVKLPHTATGAMVVRDELEFDGPAGRPPSAALAVLHGLLRRDQPVAVARLRTVRRVHELQDESGRSLAEVDDDEVSVIDGRRLAARFRQLEVEVRAETSDGLLPSLQAVLERAGAAPDPVSKAARALGPRAEGPPEASAAKVRPADPAGAAVTAAIAASTARLLRHDPRVRLGDDPEAVHQARVATRRLRADLRTFRTLLDAAWSGGTTAELRWLGGSLGAVRDSEVLRDLTVGLAHQLQPDDRAAARRLLDGLGKEHEKARHRLLGDLESERYLELLELLINAGRGAPVTDEAQAAAEEVLPGLVQGAWKRVRKAVRALPDEPADESLHEIRILAKRLRYAAEAVGIALPGYDMLAKEAAAVQDVLGKHQDAVVAQGWLRKARLSSSAVQAYVAGELWGLAGAEATAARREWPAAWKSLRKRAKAAL